MTPKTEQSNPSIRLVRLHEVLEIIPISASTWWEGIKTGRFPAPIKLGPRLTFWRLNDILGLVDAGTTSTNRKAIES